MKRLFYNKSLMCEVLVLIFFLSHFLVYGQKTTIGQVQAGPDSVFLHIAGILPAYKTRNADFISKNFLVLLNAGLLGNRYQWLRVSSDSTRIKETYKFTLKGKILDFDKSLNLDLQLINDSTESLLSYQVNPDSISAQIAFIAREISRIIDKKINRISSGNLKILIRQFTSPVKDNKNADLCDFYSSELFNTLSRSLADNNNLTIELADTSNQYNDENYDIIISGNISRGSEGSIMVSLNSLYIPEQLPLFGSSYTFQESDIFIGPELLANKLVNLLKVFPAVHQDFIKLNKAEEFYKAGLGYLNESNYIEGKLKANVMFEKALELDSVFVPAIQAIADMYFKDYKYSAAIPFYLKSIRLDSTLTESYIKAGTCYYYDYQDKKAFDYLNKAVLSGLMQKNDELTASAYKTIGDINLDRRFYSLAISNYNKAKNLDPKNSDIWFASGKAFSILADSAGILSDTMRIVNAVNCFIEGSILFPDEQRFSRNASFVLNKWGKEYYWDYIDYNKMGKGDSADFNAVQAYKKFSRAVQLNHYDSTVLADSYTYLAYLLYYARNIKDKPRAKYYSRQAVNLKSPDEWSYRLFVVFHLDEPACYNESMIAIKKAISIEKTTNGYHALGDLYYTKEKFDSAFFAYSKSIELRDVRYLPDDLLGRYCSAAIESAVKNSDLINQARQFITVQFGHYPSNKPLLNGLIILYDYKKDYDAEEKAIDTYFEQNLGLRDKAWGYLKRADLKRKKGEYKNSLVFIKKALNSGLDINYYPAAQVITDNLFLANNYPDALDVTIRIVENLLDSFKTYRNYFWLAGEYLYKKNIDKSVQNQKEAFKLAKNSLDTANCYVLLAEMYYRQLVNSDTLKLDPEAISSYADSAIFYYTKASKMKSDFTESLILSRMQLIYHEYKIDYEKSYDFTMKILALDSSNRVAILNSVEAELTSGRFPEAYKTASMLLNEDNQSKIHLKDYEILPINYLVIASAILNGQRNQSSKQEIIQSAYGSFKNFRNNYSRLKSDNDKSWTWNGTKKFLAQYHSVSEFYLKILTQMIEALEGKKAKGEILLDDIDNRWIKYLESK